MDIIRVTLSSHYNIEHHDYDGEIHKAQRDRAGCLLIINSLNGKLVKAYSPLAWLDVSKVSTMVDNSKAPF